MELDDYEWLGNVDWHFKSPYYQVPDNKVTGNQGNLGNQGQVTRVMSN